MTQPNVDFRSELAGQAGALRLLAMRLASVDDAEDLTHDAVVTALDARAQPRRMRPWLRQVLRNAAKARHRAEVRRRTREERVGTWSQPVSLEDEVERAQMAQAVQDALGGLDPAYRRVLEARFYEDRTAADIARSEGCPAGTVRWRVQEGLRRMRSSLDARFEGREAWRDRMAAFASAPLALAGPPPGEPHMISSSLFTKLALGAAAASLAAGAAVVATSDSPEPAMEQPRSRPQMSAVSSSSADVRVAAQTAFSVTADASHPALDSRQPPNDEPGCQTCSEGVPVFDAISACQESFAVSDDGRIDVHIELEGSKVHMVEVRSDSDADDELADCLRSALPGSEAEPTADGPMPDMVNIAIMATDRQVPLDVEASTPAEMADAGMLPTRTEGEDPVRTVVACGDYECPFCERVRPTLEQVLDENADVRIAWMHAPLPSHPGAHAAARAAVAAQAQGRFWDMHEALFDRPDAHGEDDLRAIAAELGLDTARFEADFTSEATRKAVDDQRASCMKSGGRGTPSFFLGDQMMMGARDIDGFRDLLE